MGGRSVSGPAGNGGGNNRMSVESSRSALHLPFLHAYSSRATQGDENGVFRTGKGGAGSGGKKGSKLVKKDKKEKHNSVLHLSRHRSSTSEIGVDREGGQKGSRIARALGIGKKG
jgi:hypothetical protein